VTPTPRPDDPTDWITALVRSHRVRLLALARRQGLAPDRAFDCVQDAFCTFLRLPQARDLADRPDDAARLLKTVVFNAARTTRRRTRGDHQTVESIESDAPSADEMLSRVEAHGSLKRCVSELNDLQRSVVTLRMLDELPGDEVAAALGITAQHVAVVLHRAKASLRGCMTAAGHCPHGCANDRNQGGCCEDNDRIRRRHDV
jgi:RNA polymerase sigma-70 factor (ECF subfamily)